MRVGDKKLVDMVLFTACDGDTCEAEDTAIPGGCQINEEPTAENCIATRPKAAEKIYSGTCEIVEVGMPCNCILSVVRVIEFLCDSCDTNTNGC